jgi:DTW domain-containing protein YfiP
VKPFDPGVQFVILIHPIEARRRVATGRMAHLSLRGSILIEGIEFSGHPQIRELVSSPENHCVILYPGRNSTDLSHEGAAFIPNGKKLVVFVIDGTWATAGRMIRSEDLRGLPSISFTPSTRSRFRVRRQPAAECLSTIEAIHRTIDLLGTTQDHDRLLTVFDKMVEFQLGFSESK